jgi:putative hemolysin
MTSWLLFLLLTIASVAFQSFFAMFEMASVSFNKVRLHYYLSKNKKRAKLLAFLLEKPSRLFGTTLIGVNTFLQIGSECSRRFYESIGLNPDLAPITQVFIVLIFGELAPLFAARRHSEQVALRSIPMVICLYWLFYPFIKLIDMLSSLISRKENKNFLSRDELKLAFVDPTKALDEPIENIFSVKEKKADEIMVPLDKAQRIPSTATLQELSHILSVDYHPHVLIYHRSETNIVGLIHSRVLLKQDLKKRVTEESTPPWFITQDENILDILKQFRTNNQDMAVVLSPTGTPVGAITLDQIISFLFGEEEYEERKWIQTIVEKTLSGEMTIAEFNKKFDAELSSTSATDLNELICETLHHHPAKGETIRIDRFEFIVVEPSLLGAKTLLVRTIAK